MPTWKARSSDLTADPPVSRTPNRRRSLRTACNDRDREFYDGKCLTLLQAHNYAYVTPIIKWGEAIKEELNQGWSRTIEHDLTTKFDGHSWTVEFPVYIDFTYQNGRYDEHGVARHGYNDPDTL